MLFRTMRDLGRRCGRVAGVAVAAPALALAFAGQALADGDAGKGEAVFKKYCFACHTTEAGKNKIGPSLHAVVGRHSGLIDGFAYSDANKKSGLTWDEATLNTYLTKPQALVPGTKMTFAGIKDDEERADVIAFLKTQK